MVNVWHYRISFVFWIHCTLFSLKFDWNSLTWCEKCKSFRAYTSRLPARGLLVSGALDYFGWSNEGSRCRRWWRWRQRPLPPCTTRAAACFWSPCAAILSPTTQRFTLRFTFRMCACRLCTKRNLSHCDELVRILSENTELWTSSSTR